MAYRGIYTYAWDLVDDGLEVVTGKDTQTAVAQSSVVAAHGPADPVEVRCHPNQLRERDRCLWSRSFGSGLTRS